MPDAQDANLDCSIGLYDANLDLLEIKSFNVTLTKLANMDHIQDGQVPVGESEVLVSEEKGGDECAKCDGFADVICIAWNGCWEEVFKALLALTLIGVCIYLIVFKCIPCKLISYCGDKITIPKKNNKKAKEKQQE